MKENKTFMIAVASALVASSCCWLPGLLISIGAASLITAASFIETFRIPISLIALAALGLGFYNVYSKTKTDKSSYVTETESCCPPSGRHKTVIKLVLWIVTIFVLGLLFFPHTVFSILGTSATSSEQPKDLKASEKTKIVTVHIEGMT